MNHRTVYYKGDFESPHLLEETSDMFVLRTKKGINPRSILDSAEELKSTIENLYIAASFPDSDVYIYGCSSEKGTCFHRDEIKLILRKRAHPDMVFVGSVFNDSQTGVFQIYTSNIFLKFRDGISKKTIGDFFLKHQLLEKRKLNFDANSYFVESSADYGRDIFFFTEELLLDSSVDCCHPELVTKLRSSPSSSYNNLIDQKHGLENDWWLKRIGIYKAWETTKGKGSIIAVIDDGIDSTHPAFKDKIIASRDMMAKDGLGKGDHQFDERHGTACASIASSADVNAPGVAPNSKIIPIRITGLGSVLQSEAIYWAVKNGADVISCSWGPPDGNIFSELDNHAIFPLPDHTRLAFKYASTWGRDGKGTAIIFAAGNGKEPVKYDGYASSEHVIAISSINHKDEPTIYSDYGPPTWACFPSGDFEIDSAYLAHNHTGLLVADRIGPKGYSKTDYYSLFSGTSASSPGAAGVVALMYSANPSLTSIQIKTILKQSAEKIQAGSNYNDFFGYGLIRADWAVQEAINIKTQDQMKQTSTAISLHIGINHVSTHYYNMHVPPLYGCVNDMNDMGNLARQLLYEPHFLENEQATRNTILDQIESLGNRVENGGILMITYAGHGAPIPNKRAEDSHDTVDNQDGADEAWVTFDGFLLDDEIHAALAKIESRIRVVLISDSCHSQSMTRSLGNFSMTNMYVRSIGERDVLQILKNNGSSPEDLRRNVSEKSTRNYVVLVKAMSACLKNQKASETGGRGVYTSALVRLFNQNIAKKGINYSDFVELIAREIEDFQTPSIENSHHKHEQFDAQFPFETSKIEESLPSASETQNSKTSKAENKDGKEELFIDTNELLITTIDGAENLFLSNDSSNTRSIDGSNTKGYNSWDKAYNYMIDNQDKVNSVEPEVISKLYALNDGEQSRSGGDYLSTYPNPEKHGDPEPFIWHLGDEHSGLRKANESVFPEIKIGAKQTKKKNVVKIGHIDTGYLEGHPSLPINLDYRQVLGVNTGSAIDHDEPLAVFEQHGHGNATMAILAGNWVDYEDTGDNFKGYFGAIPYAKVLPIKISETVLLFSGKRFALAVDYAISQGCDVITMSMAGLPSKVMAKAINRAYEAGVVIVSAAGNSFTKGAKKILPKRTLYPARYDRVISAVGATYTKRPYLNEYNKENTRAAGGAHMQTCYGPESALPTSLAAYTPNISWFHQNKRQVDASISYYVKSGGGTSSATPQIAAAAAIYIQKHQKELAQFKGKNAWKKAEIVRQALFLSGDQSTEFNFVFGNGLLRAHEALQTQYSPSALESGIKAAKRAPERRRLFGGFFSVFKRGIGEDTPSLNESLQDMMVTEICQLMHKDEQLFPFLDSVDLDSEDLNLDNKELVQLILKSSYASDFLKRHLSQYEGLSENGSHHIKDDISSRIFKSNKGDIKIESTGIEYQISNTKSFQDRLANDVVWIDEFDLEITSTRSLRGDLEPSLSIEVDDDELDSVMMVEEVYDDGTVYQWKHHSLDELDNKSGTRSMSSTEVRRNLFTIKPEAINNQERSLARRLKRMVVRITKWVKKKITAKLPKIDSLVKHLGDHNYDILVYDLKTDDRAGVWQNIDTLEAPKIYKAISDDPKPLLLLFQGLFRKVNASFDDFLNSPEIRKKLLKKYGRYVIGLNMPTIVHRVKENADHIEKLFEGKLKQKACTALAMSRGGVVARHLFEENWVNKTSRQPKANAPFVLDTLVMFGTPNQGTMIASSDNWRSFFNYATNISRFTLGTVAPVVPTIISALKALGLGFVNLPGIDDMEEQSEIIIHLNNIKMNRDNYFVFTSNYEPRKGLLKKLFNEFIIDRVIFKKEDNDGVTPAKGAVFANEDLSNSIDLIEGKQYMKCPKRMQVSHFSYLDEKHTKVSKKLFQVIS